MLVQNRGARLNRLNLYSDSCSAQIDLKRIRRVGILFKFCGKYFRKYFKFIKWTKVINVGPFSDDRFNNLVHFVIQQKDRLSRHVRIVHYKEKPFVCNMCEYSTGRKDKLKRHQSTVHSQVRSYHQKNPKVSEFTGHDANLHRSIVCCNSQASLLSCRIILVGNLQLLFKRFSTPIEKLGHFRVKPIFIIC